MPRSASIDSGEISRFASKPQDWWDPEGVWKPLHKLNPVRIDYILQTVCNRFRLSSHDQTPFKGLAILDLGCGGGLLSEPMAALGAKVTGLDASAKAVEVARNHAELGKLKISYINSSAEAFANGGQKFDVILAMEILEHVADMDSLLTSINTLLKPDGIAIFSTVNRTTKSFLLGIVAAEYLLGWVPSGLHDWNKFVRPSELAERLNKAGMDLTDITGMTYNPFKNEFALNSHNVGVNYLASAIKIKT